MQGSSFNRAILKSADAFEGPVGEISLKSTDAVVLERRSIVSCSDRATRGVSSVRKSFLWVVGTKQPSGDASFCAEECSVSLRRLRARWRAAASRPTPKPTMKNAELAFRRTLQRFKPSIESTATRSAEEVACY